MRTHRKREKRLIAVLLPQAGSEENPTRVGRSQGTTVDKTAGNESHWLLVPPELTLTDRQWERGGQVRLRPESQAEDLEEASTASPLGLHIFLA